MSLWPTRPSVSARSSSRAHSSASWRSRRPSPAVRSARQARFDSYAVPQIIKTFRLKRAGELSPLAFSIWAFADCLIIAAIALQGLLITNLVLCVRKLRAGLTVVACAPLTPRSPDPSRAVYAVSNLVIVAQSLYYTRYPGGRGTKRAQPPRIETLTWLDRALLLLFVALPLAIWAGVIFVHRHTLLQRPGFDGVDAHLKPAPFALSWIGVALYEVCSQRWMLC